MEKFKNYLFYGNLSKREWSLVRDAIWKDNRFILMTVSFSMTLLMTILAIYTVTFDHIYHDNAAAYGIIAVIELVLYLLSKSTSESSFRLLPAYTFVFNLVMFIFGIALGTFLDPTSYALGFVIMIIVLPMLFCIRPIHSITSVIVVDVAFLIVSSQFKEADIFYADVMNVVIWSIVGFFLNAITTTARVQSRFEFYKNEEAQKEVRESFKQVATQMAMFKSLGNVYSSLYYIDLKTDSYVELVSLPSARTLFGNSGGGASSRLKSFCNTSVADYFRQQVLEFTDLLTVHERFKDQNMISMQYLGVVDQSVVKKMEWRELSMIAVNRDENSEVISVLFASRQIHEEKLKEINQMERLQKALASAESANKSKTIFLNNMSHDIRTPMNAISGFTSLAKKHADEPALVRDYLDKISVANKHLLSLVNDVMDMSRIESGRINLNVKDESLSSIVAELKTLVQDEVFSRRQLFQIKTNVQHDIVRCDRLRMKQVILNLLSNAIKFTPNGGKVDLEIDEVESSKKGIASFKIVVRDTGIGMSNEFLKKIFEPFERENSSTVDSIQGTGLGMAIAKNLVDMMNGCIYVRSVQNEGTEVLLEVTFDVGAESSISTSGRSENAVVILPDQFAGRRILLVEDNRMSQMMVRHLLKETGVDIQMAENGQEACEMLEKAGRGFFDLILMDIQMPVMDGYEATTVIRGMNDKALADIPIIAMTAEAYEEDRQKAFALGMNDHIAKPIEAEKLNAALLKVLG